MHFHVHNQSIFSSFKMENHQLEQSKIVSYIDDFFIVYRSDFIHFVLLKKQCTIDQKTVFMLISLSSSSISFNDLFFSLFIFSVDVFFSSVVFSVDFFFCFARLNGFGQFFSLFEQFKNSKRRLLKLCYANRFGGDENNAVSTNRYQLIWLPERHIAQHTD